jgi:hypothetical protein
LSGIHGIIIGEKPRDRKAPGNEWKKPIAQRDKTLYCKFQIAKCKMQNVKGKEGWKVSSKIGDVDEFVNFSIKSLLFERKSNDLLD